MSTATETIEGLVKQEYKYGFFTDIEADAAPPGLNEDIIRLISAKKNEPEFMLDWRLKSYRHWLKMTEPKWQNVHYPPIDYQAFFSTSVPNQTKPSITPTRPTPAYWLPTRHWESLLTDTIAWPGV